MKRLMIFFIGLLIPIINYGQSELAMISTSGEAIVRGDKSADSEILFSIKEHELFLCEPTSDNWWKIDDFYSKTGFVHKSKIQLIRDLTENQQRDLIIYSINGLSDYRLKYDSIRLTLPNEERMKTLQDYEDFEETISTPLLPFLSELFCNNKDIELLDKYLDIMIVNQMSANEAPAWSLGDCYLCQPALVIKRIDNYSGKDREYLWSMLTFGFKNVTWQKESEIENYDELKKALIE